MSASNKYTDFHKDVKIEVVPGKGKFLTWSADPFDNKINFKFRNKIIWRNISDIIIPAYTTN